MRKPAKRVACSLLTAALLLQGAPFASASEMRSTIERRLRPGGGLFETTSPAASRQQTDDICSRVSGERVRFVPGDAVEVAVATDVKDHRQVLGTVESGRELEVLSVEGPWVATEVVVEGEPVRGWILAEHLRPADAPCS